ncbi:olfactory receptor 2AT4-like [Eublepharis macularius]|uniref:Olfactory receptor 2AT4-like n=1 Tax=Eublepharis macularius TaxID=481883 RepID=A0AA97J2Y5_EUBMA|nr:olfactory receptor 2AT4-like [Eublepharis macularius]
MANCNGSTLAKEFLLAGLPALHNYHNLLFVLFLSFYLLILIGNLAIISVIVAEEKLHKPMYFFLTNLSVLDILFTTTTIPKMLAMFLVDAKSISPPACFLQMYCFHSLTVTEAFLLVVMAYDRYEAICNPLHYPVKMTKRMNIQLAASSWLVAFLVPVPVIIETSNLGFGERTLVYHCFCDHLAVVRAACSNSDSNLQKFVGFSIAMTISVTPLILVVVSYIHIILSVLRISSKEGRSKAFSTCSSHLIVVGTYYFSITVAYASYQANMPLDIQVLSTVTFAILTPLLNPLIYTLRNKEVKSTLEKFILLRIPSVLQKNCLI